MYIRRLFPWSLFILPVLSYYPRGFFCTVYYEYKEAAECSGSMMKLYWLPTWHGVFLVYIISMSAICHYHFKIKTCQSNRVKGQSWYANYPSNVCVHIATFVITALQMSPHLMEMCFSECRWFGYLWRHHWQRSLRSHGISRLAGWHFKW